MESSASLNSLPVIPPISSEANADNLFLNCLNDWLAEELSTVDAADPDQCYHVHKEAFDRIVQYLGVYKVLLYRIKAEYESCIDTIRNGQHEAFFLSGKLNEVANAPTALRNYKRRAEDLKNKISVVEEDNDRLCNELNELREQRASKEQEKQNRTTAENRKKEEYNTSKLQNKGPVPGLTIDQATDCDLLRNELGKLENDYKYLSVSYHTRYSSRTVEEDLKESLATSAISRDQLFDEIVVLRQKQLKLMVAIEAAQAYLKIQPPHETIGQAVTAALAREADNIGSDTVKDLNRPATPSTMTEEEDLQRENDTQALLDYIEKFNELLENQMYSEAAIHAANSIKGILRTPETMQRFKDLSVRLSHLPCSPLLTFCEALVSTVPSFGARPNQFMSNECVRCALQENRLDLLFHWLSQDRLTTSEAMADVIFNFCMKNTQPSTVNCMSLAQKIYMDVMAHVSAMICMVKQGRINQAIDYADRKGCLADDLIQVLCRCPDLQFANALYESARVGSYHTTRTSLPVGTITSVLLKTGSIEDALCFIQDVYSRELQEFGMDAMKDAILNDDITTLDQWMNIVEHCRDNSHMTDFASRLLATITVNLAVKNASKNLQDNPDPKLP